MTKETYLAIVAIYGIEKVIEAKKIDGGELFSHAAAIRHHKAAERKALLESKKSSAFVARKLGFTTRYIEILRKKMRDRKK